MKTLIGKKIVMIRQMTKLEKMREGWDDPYQYPDRNPIAIVLDNRTILYPSQDEEGSNSGEIFGIDEDGEQFMLIEGGLS